MFDYTNSFYSSIITLFFISLALSLDAFAVSITCGIKLQNIQIKKYLKISLTFGIYQALMPLLGWSIGHLLKDFIENYAHFVAFAIFLVLGLKTIFDALKKNNATEFKSCNCTNHACLASLGLATSIDAFIIGIVLALTSINILFAITFIGVTTFLISLSGNFIGHNANRFIGKKAQIIAGIILIMLAVKILWEKYSAH